MTSITMSDLSPELLAQHDGWLRALVRRLVDDGQADDVVQEVWGQAMTAELRDQKALPAWLARVARRIAGKSVRSKQRRRNHEQVAAQVAPTASVDPAELVARVEGRQQIAQSVLELSEPFRTVVLLRYFEDQTPEQIAQKLNIPGATVRTRLHRAHEQLRQRFESERGKEWRGQLAGLVAPIGAPLGTDGAVQPPMPIATAPPRALLLLVPIAVAALVWVIVQTMSPTQPPVAVPGSDGGVASVATTDQGDKALHDVGNATERDTATVGDASNQTPTARLTVRIAGQVIDYAGAPLSELEIVYAKGWPKRGGPDAADCQIVGRCDPEGRFDVQVPRDQGTLRVSSQFATLRSWQISGNEAPAGIDDALIVATRFVQLTGIVVDKNGNPAPDQTVRATIDDTVGLPVVLSGTYLELFNFKTTSDAVGNFQLRNVPAFPFGTLGVGHAITNDAMMAIPTQDRHDLRLVLGTNKRKYPQRSKAKKTVPTTRWFDIVGTVVTLTGEPILGASTRAAKTDVNVTTKADGKFKLSGRAMPGSPAIVWVSAQGFAPMQLEVWPEQGDQPALVTARLAKLGADTSAIAGTIVNEHNVPISDLMVTLADPTPFDVGSFVPRFVERPEAHRLGAHATTDSHGKFRIPGVLDRAYHLRIFDEATGFAQTHGPFHARQEWTVHITQPRARPEFRLHVGNTLGNEVEAAEVRIEVVLLHTESDSGFGSMWTTSFVGETHKAITDYAGDCRFLNAPGGDLRITITKPGYIPQTITHKAKTNVLDVNLQRLLPFRVATHGFDNQWPLLKLYDDDGNELEAQAAWRGNHYPSTYKFGIVRSHSVVAAFPESVSRAELCDMFTHKVLRTMPVTPNPTGITLLDFPN